MRTPRVIDYFDEFTDALWEELLRAEEKWDNEWLEQDREHQVERIFDKNDEYYEEWLENDKNFPWLSVAGNAMIAWIRDNHPELSENWS